MKTQVGLVAIMFLVGVARADQVGFAARPEVTKSAKGVAIAFAASAPTDVEVAVLDVAGKVVRHLVAGQLGGNAPAPLQKDSLKQQVVWDRTDDLGRPAKGGPFRARVRIGATPRLEKYVGWNGNTLEAGIVGVAVGEKGEVYVLFASGHGRCSIRVFDRNGQYARTILPYPADTPKERAAPVGQLEIEGERIPIVFNSHGGNLSPLTAGMKTQTMAFSPKGHLLLASAVGTISNHRPPRYILAVHPQGGAPKDLGFIGPQMRGLAGRGIGFMGGAGEAWVRWYTHLATSPDGEWIYLTDAGSLGAFKPSHCVYRLKWTDRTPGLPRRGKQYRDRGPDDLGKPFLGTFREPGDDDAHLNDPQGIGVDKDGNVYVCDRGNGRVMVFTADGKPLGKFPVAHPEQIAVHPATGEIYVLCRERYQRGKKLATPTLRKFSAWGAGQPKEMARLAGKISLAALDPAARPPKLWAVVAGNLAPITDAGGALKLGEPVNNHDGVKYPGFLAADPARGRVIYREMLTGRAYKPLRTLDLTTGKRAPFLKGTDAALDRHGNIYVMDGYGTNSMSRYDPAGKPLPFPGADSNRMDTGSYSSYGPDIGLRGHCVALNGDIYLIRSNKWVGGVASRVDVFGPDGKPKKPNLVDGLQAGDCGIGVDAAGNVYIGVNVKAKDQPLPKAFMGKVPTQNWSYWRFDREGPRELPWAYPYQNTYLNHWGSVMKFGPGGGAFYGLAGKPRAAKGQPVPPVPALADINKAPPGSTPYWSGYLKKECRVTGALWRYPGVGIIPCDFGWGDPGCICWNSRLAVDAYGRVFAPNVFRFCVETLDTNGNHLGRIGRYGNSDNAGPGSRRPEPEIAFAWPAFVSTAGGKVYVSDSTNRRITVVRFDHAAEGECRIP